MISTGKADCIGVDWDEIEGILQDEVGSDVTVDEDIITVEMICAKYNVKPTCARGKLKMLIASGKYEEYWVGRSETSHKTFCAKKVYVLE
jgi:hypothetical protein